MRLCNGESYQLRVDRIFKTNATNAHAKNNVNEFPKFYHVNKKLWNMRKQP